jgi:acetyl esterase/lipase
MKKSHSLLLLLTTAFCASLQAANIEPTYKNVQYGDHKDQHINFWKIESEKPAPLYVLIHGGGWLGGKNEDTVAENMLTQGYCVASVEYRLAGVELLPAAVHDAARAIQFLRYKAKEWNIDPTRILCQGGSAGAASSLWLAYHDDMADPDSKDPVARQSSRISGAIGMGGQTIFDPFLLEKEIGLAAIKHPMVWKTFGAKSHDDLKERWDTFKALSTECAPLTHVTKDDPPVYIRYGKPAPVPVEKGDGIHHAGFGKLLKAKCDEVGIPCHLNVGGETTSEISQAEFVKKVLKLE